MGRRIEALWDELGGFPRQSVFGLNGSRGSEHKGQKHIAQAGGPEPPAAVPIQAPQLVLPQLVLFPSILGPEAEQRRILRINGNLPTEARPK